MTKRLPNLRVSTMKLSLKKKGLLNHYWILDKKFCEPGKRFRKDCNICTCGKDGKTAFCTLKACTKEHNYWQNEGMQIFSMNSII